MSNDQKRVYCLYRVSTLKQLEKDAKEDIPMQQQVCHEFAEQQGWKIVGEKYEKGISGFKVSASDRDAIQELQAAAADKQFDILLVFMFDRLGRKEDETPFIVEWFVNNGIEVWSAMEGQQRFDTHVDKLMNYIRYWQASGESIKTSMRTKTRLSQIVQEGRFRGGPVPYGYRIEKQGRLNKRGHEVYEILVDETEAAVVELIFNLYLNKGYGSKRICTYLEDNEMMNRSGTNFVNCTIQHMLKNETYTGMLKCGETKTDIFPDLQIIDPDTFAEVQEMVNQRSEAYRERNKPLYTKGKGLLSGCFFCGHCGGRLVITTSTKQNRLADGSLGKKYIRYRYVCYNRTRHKSMCDGQTGYTVHKVDEIIDQVIRGILNRAKNLPEKELLNSKFERRNNELRNKLEVLTEKYQKCESDVAAIKAEMMNVIRGDSALDRETINNMLTQSLEEFEEAKEALELCTDELNDGELTFTKLKKTHDKVVSWADIYDQCDLDSKKMIVSKLIHEVRIDRNYELEIDFNISYAEYCSDTLSVVGISPELLSISQKKK